ncbi:hypothetical protein AWI26_04925 [Enterobacter kobei]|uniref:Uncharacterized protein n=2 Tax=Enterobacter kobei TaxID=208224 RepID=A0A2J0PCG1_9ENTR|nr:hypothetical protein ECENHK_14050 [Enterobacter kobei]AIX54307.1 hypothetical protein ECNIH4_08570 [Enterobacter cloacae]OWS67252.1 hypothetical protein WM88_07430 [Enterobacter cloacae complex sp. ECNIH6]POV83340.1 hypothetical protein C3382_08045 [Enterobacter cloacae complex sp. ECNIH9]PYZ31137.1 hypothetical protein DNK77_02135 [Enterobacter cloacae complex sp.]
MMKYLPYLFLNLSTRRTNSGVIGLNGGKFTVNFFFLMAGITVIEKSISVAKKIIEILKKNLKVVLDQTITPLTAMKPKGGNPNLTKQI